MTSDEFRQSLTATEPPLGRNPCRSSSHRRHFQRVFHAVRSLDMHGHAAASRKMLKEIGDDLLRCFLRRGVERLTHPEHLHG